MAIEQKKDPPDPNAECTCGLDTSADGSRHSNLCPKHDGRYYDVVTEDDEGLTVDGAIKYKVVVQERPAET